MLKYKVEHIDSYGGQDNMELGLYLGDDIIGLVQYVLYGEDLTHLDNGSYYGEYALYEETVETFEDEYVLTDEAIKITNGEWEDSYVLEDEAYVVVSDFTDTDGLDFYEGDIITKYDAKTLSNLGAKIKEFN